MRKFKCSICGYTYDESEGIADQGIGQGTKWEETPQDFTCPWCGAPKSVFEEHMENHAAAAPETLEEVHFEDIRELGAGELSVVCSNLAKGCEKQQLTEEMALFNQLADYYKSKVAYINEKNFNNTADLLNTDLSQTYPKANSIAAAQSDRGALRALVWSEKVSRMIKSLLERYAKEGETFLENTKIYVCDICGFIYCGNDLPEICPVCKVPRFRISEVGRR